MHAPSQLKKSLFGRKQSQSAGLDSVFSPKINDMNRRLKVIEGRYSNLRRKTQLTEQNLLHTNRKISTEVKTISSDITEIKRSLLEATMKIREIREELTRCAKKQELKLLDKYLSFWEPINYVTAEGVERIAKDIIEQNKTKALNKKQL